MLYSSDGEEFEFEESVAKRFREMSKKQVDSSSSKVIGYSKKMITPCSYDGEEFDIEESVVKVLQMIKNMTGGDCAGSVIPLPDVNNKVLSKVIEYLKKHVDYSLPKSDEMAADEELKAWDAEFVKIDRAMFYDLIMEVLQETFEYNLLKFDNKVRFILSIVEGKIIFSRRCEDLFHELHRKGFTPFPVKTKDIDAAIEGPTVDSYENMEECSETVVKKVIMSTCSPRQ